MKQDKQDKQDKCGSDIVGFFLPLDAVRCFKLELSELSAKHPKPTWANPVGPNLPTPQTANPSPEQPALPTSKHVDTCPKHS